MVSRNIGYSSQNALPAIFLVEAYKRDFCSMPGSKRHQMPHSQRLVMYAVSKILAAEWNSVFLSKIVAFSGFSLKLLRKY